MHAGGSACTSTRRRRCGKRKTSTGSTWRSRAWTCGGGTRTTANRAREANLDFVRNREYSPPDIMIFADSTSAREIPARHDFFRDREELNKWPFLPIIDEFPATVDCNIQLAKNEMLDNIFFDMLRMRLPYPLLMSASPMERQISESQLALRAVRHALCPAPPSAPPTPHSRSSACTTARAL
jgi:hypothetical protein